MSPAVSTFPPRIPFIKRLELFQAIAATSPPVIDLAISVPPNSSGSVRELAKPKPFKVKNQKADRDDE